MQYGVQYYYINNDVQFQGILKVETVREFDQFIIKFNLHQFKTTDPVILKSIEQQCNENSTRLEILDRVDSSIIVSCSLTYTEIEEYSRQLKQLIQSIWSQSQDLESRYTVDIYNRMKVVLTTRQLTRLYNYISEFYKLYMMLENIFKLTINSTSSSQPAKEKISNYARTPEPKVTPPPPIEMNTVVPSTLDNILKFGVNNIIKSSLIHFVFNYFKYVSKDICFVQNNDDESISIVCPQILPGNYIFDTHYFKSLIESIVNIEEDKLGFYVSKLINAVAENKEKMGETPIYMMMTTYLIFIYSLKCLHSSHQTWLHDKIDDIVSDPVKQESILNHHIKTYSQIDKKISFSVRGINVFEYESEDDIETIKKISEEHSYLIPVDQMKFAEIVLNQADKVEKNIMPIDFHMGRKRVFDLVNLEKSFNNNHSGGRRKTLFATDSLSPVITDDIMESELLHYEFTSTDGLLTNCYRQLVKYVENPSTIMLIKENIIPTTVKKLFETLKIIMNANIFDKNEMNTLRFYEILCQQIPNAKILSHTTLLYIVFQIIIPYYVDVNKIKIFNDQLLIQTNMSLNT